MTTTEHLDPLPTTTTEHPDPTTEPPAATTSATNTNPPTPHPAAPGPRFRLVRTRRDRKLAGVCAGIARELDLDVTLVRVAFVAAAFAGFGIPLYLAAAILAPVVDDERPVG